MRTVLPRSSAWHDLRVLGAPVRVHNMTGDDLGIARVPTPVEPGDLVLLEHVELCIRDVILTGSGSPLYALVRVQPVHLRPLVSG